MSGTLVGGRFLAALSLAAGLALVAPAFGDDLEKFRAKNEIAVQKLLADVNAALARSRTLEKTDPTRARDLLRKTLAGLEDDLLLPEKQRSALHQQVQSRLRAVIDSARAKERTDELAAQNAAAKAKEEQRRQEAEDHPGPAGVAQKYIGTGRNQVSAAERLRLDKAKGFRDALSGVDRSAVPFDGTVEFPKYWKELTDRRKPRLSPQEVALLKALNSTLSVNFENSKFEDALNYLSERTGQPIILDRGSLREAMIDEEDYVNFKVNKITFRTILKKILADRGLAYVLKEGTIQVVTAQKAREMMTVRSYPVDDLIGGDPRFGPFLNRAMMQQNVQGLIEMIQSSVEPSSWQVNGGPGTITFFEPGRALIIRNSAELHYMLDGTLR